MKKALFILLLITISFTIYSQDTDTSAIDTIPKAVKFDYDTYNGTPIKNGYLLNGPAYRIVYSRLGVGDSLLLVYSNKIHQQNIIIDSQNKQLEEQKKRITKRDTTINKLQQNLNKMNDKFQQCSNNTELLTKQFWTIGNVSIHKKTFGISVGMGAASVIILRQFMK